MVVRPLDPYDPLDQDLLAYLGDLERGDLPTYDPDALNNTQMWEAIKGKQSMKAAAAWAADFTTFLDNLVSEETNGRRKPEAGSDQAKGL